MSLFAVCIRLSPFRALKRQHLHRSLRICTVFSNLIECRLNSCSTSKMAANMATSGRAVAAVLQMTSTADKAANREQAVTLLDRARQRGAQIAFLPECFDYIGDSKEVTQGQSEPLDGETVQFYRQYAKENNMWLSLGGLHEQPPDFETDRRLLNTHVLIDSAGQVRGHYSKAHLFDLDLAGSVQLRESDYTRPGHAIHPPVVTLVGNVGLAICYDLRFPEMALALRQQGAHVITYPSAFTVPTGMAHWHTLLKARAIETQCYVIAAAQVGRHNAKRASYGHALIVDPWGTVVAECRDEIDVAVADIDLAYLQRRRGEMPVLQHRRPELYSSAGSSAENPDTQDSYRFGQVTVPSSAVFYRTQLNFAFVNRKPVLLGHVLVCPLRHVLRFNDLTPAEVADLWITVQHVSKVIERVYGGTSLTMAVQDGNEAGQTIQHTHVHVLPRKKGDFESNDDIYNELQKHDKHVTAGEWRTDADMADEAGRLRVHFR